MTTPHSACLHGFGGGSEYYDGSAPRPSFGGRRAYPPDRVWLTRPARTATCAVPTFTAFRSTGLAPGFAPAASSRLRGGTFTMTSQARPVESSQDFPHRPRASAEYAPLTSPHPPGSSWPDLQEGLQHRFLSCTVPSRSPSPDRSGSVRPARLRRGCSHPPQRLLDQDAASFTDLPRQASGGVLSPPLETTAPRGAPPLDPQSRRS
jgi:hypothetical protein